jgi:hypothetical protein
MGREYLLTFTVDGHIYGYSLIMKTQSVTKSRRFCQLTVQRWINLSAPRTYVHAERKIHVCGSLVAVPPRQLLRHLGLACILCCRLSIGRADEFTERPLNFRISAAKIQDR